jgi:hypothetical protein
MSAGSAHHAHLQSSSVLRLLTDKAQTTQQLATGRDPDQKLAAIM